MIRRRAHVVVSSRLLFLFWLAGWGAVLPSQVGSFPERLDPSPSGMIEGNSVNAGLGSGLSSAGDVNGDGYDDVLAGAPGGDGGGRAMLYLGSPSGLRPGPDWVMEGSQSGGFFGSAVGGAGDVNGDGYDDVLVAAVLHSNGETEEGKVFLFLGSPAGLGTTPAWTAEGNREYAFYGTVARAAGDVNGDGFGDIVIGASGFGENGGDSRGLAEVYHGSPVGPGDLPAWRIEGGEPFDRLGLSAGTAGDVNADGYDDLILGVPGYDGFLLDQGRAEVFLGSPAGLAATAVWTGEGGGPWQTFYGTSVSTAGDVNGDGYDDIIVGQYSGAQQAGGRASVYLGAPSGPEAAPVWQADGEAFDRLGESVSTAGDVDDDGFDDVLVAAPDDDDIGKVFLFRGSSLGPELLPAWTTLGLQARSSFGSIVAPAGDLDGNRLGDVLVADRMFTRPELREGAVFFFLSLPDNSRPEAAAGSDTTRECESPGGASGVLDGSASSDPDSSPGTHDDIVLFEWFEDLGTSGEVFLGTGEHLPVMLPLGAHHLSLRVTDRAGATDVDDILIQVVDTMPPDLDVRVSPSSLWPPDHRMVEVEAIVDARDRCGVPVVVLEAIESSESDDGTPGGHGTMVGDVQGAETGTADLVFRLRRERGGAGGERRYFVTYRATDESGHAVTATAIVAVPHDRRD